MRSARPAGADDARAAAPRAGAEPRRAVRGAALLGLAPRAAGGHGRGVPARALRARGARGRRGRRGVGEPRASAEAVGPEQHHRRPEEVTQLELQKFSFQCGYFHFVAVSKQVR